MQTITFLNQKGGVGKTSTVFHVSVALAAQGLRVLLVDNDPQASLTQGFFGPEGAEAVDPACSVAALYDPGPSPPPEAVVTATGLPGVGLILGSIALNDHNVPRAVGWGDRQWGMKAFLDECDAAYDLALIDCPPNLMLCSWASLLAAAAVIVPLQAEDFGSQGLAPVRRSVEAARRGGNPGLRLAGYLLTMFDRRLALHGTYEEILRETYGDAVFTEAVPRSKDFGEAVAHRKPVGLTRPRSAAARSMAALASELRARVGGIDGAGTGRGAA